MELIGKLVVYVLTFVGIIVGLALVVLVLLLALGVGLDIRRRRRLRTGGDPGPWKRARAGRGFDVEELARRLELDAQELRAVRPYYREVTIPKRDGTRRRLHVPDAATRELQRRILHRVLARLRSHDAACGFERGRSIVDNARPHVGSAVVIRADIVDFFPSTRVDRIDWYFRRVGWDREAAEILTALTTWKRGLPQGAPTSPRLSNLVNFYLDVQMASKMARHKGRYTRYADDITVSFPADHPRHVRGAVQSIRKVLRSKGYTMHTGGKLKIRRRHQQQNVTGLVVNQDLHLPRSTRRWLRAVEHRIATGREATISRAQLAGWKGLVAMVERSGPAAPETH